MAIKFKNHYNQIGKKEGFKTKYNAPDTTDQSQVSSASITEMARRYGIDAIIAKAKQTNVEATSALAGHLYGIDYTKTFTSREDMLNTKKKLSTLFDKVPAEIRKTQFKDNIVNFVNAMTTNDEKKIESLAKIGLVSESQFEQIKHINKTKALQKQEQASTQAFMTELAKKQGDLYEQFKKTGNISFNIMPDNTANNTNLQNGIQQPSE